MDNIPKVIFCEGGLKYCRVHRVVQNVFNVSTRAAIEVPNYFLEEACRRELFQRRRGGTCLGFGRRRGHKRHGEK